MYYVCHPTISLGDFKRISLIRINTMVEESLLNYSAVVPYSFRIGELGQKVRPEILLHVHIHYLESFETL